MKSMTGGAVLSFMLAVPDTPTAIDWYEKALGAAVLWSLGSVAALQIDGSPFLLHEPVMPKFSSPTQIGTTTLRVELFVERPDEVIARALSAGATGGRIEDHARPWGTHRQGDFTDPFGHTWHVGDRSPLNWSSKPKPQK
jgi:PhnB protein